MINTAQQFKQNLLNQLYSSYPTCNAFPLYKEGATQVVFGEGNPNAQLMIIGEAPGQEEDRLGRPFVGRSGALLTKALQDDGLKREDVFITNVVKCRPPNNRTPTPDEIESYTTLLLQAEIKIVRPQVILLLGSVALQAVLKMTGITKLRGTQIKHEGSIVIPTYHPAYILRNPPAFEDLRNDIKLAKTLINKA